LSIVPQSQFVKKFNQPRESTTFFTIVTTNNASKRFEKGEQSHQS